MGNYFEGDMNLIDGGDSMMMMMRILEELMNISLGDDGADVDNNGDVDGDWTRLGVMLMVLEQLSLQVVIWSE